VEDVLRQHPAIAECAVVGVPDSTWGEVVAVAAEVGERADIDLSRLQAWASERLAPEKLPRRLTIVSSLPRNAMGKVTKPAVRELFGSEADR
jgi:malonyl-CoA/methylmalonyl-CoA synthetase